LQDDIRAILKKHHHVDSKFIVDLFVQGIGLDVVTKVWYALMQCALYVYALLLTIINLAK
jgi:hypothetical protein